MSSRVARIPEHILIGAIAALATAALHLAIVMFNRHVLGRFSWHWASREVWWMVPLGYLTLFLALSIPLGVLATVRRNDFGIRTTAFLWTLVGGFSVALLFTRLYTLAAVALALGIAVQVARLAARRPEVTRRAMPRAGLALTILFALPISLILARRALETRRLLATREPAPSNAPNVILVVWDATRARNLSLYGNPRPTTPFLDSLARNATVFERAIAAAPWTLPSHASMFTGQYASLQSGDHLSPMDGRFRTIAEELRAHGYSTGGFVANLQYASNATGLSRGFTHYEDRPSFSNQVLVSTTITQSYSVLAAFEQLRLERWLGGAVRKFMRLNGRPFGGMFPWPARRNASEITDGFLRWQAKAAKPFFAFLNYMEAHDPREAPTMRRFNGGTTPIDRYDGAVFSLDQELRRLVRGLDSAGVLQRTTIVLTSDHGELINEHGLNGHGSNLYWNVLHVPLVIVTFQRDGPGARIPRVVSLRDLAATVLTLAKIGGDSLPGTSLLQPDSIAIASPSPSPAISESSLDPKNHPRNPTHYGDLIGVVDDSLHVIRDGTGVYHVFGYQVDSGEVNDLAENPEVADWARARIEHLVAEFKLRRPNVGKPAESRSP